MIREHAVKPLSTERSIRDEQQQETPTILSLKGQEKSVITGVLGREAFSVSWSQGKVISSFAGDTEEKQLILETLP